MTKKSVEEKHSETAIFAALHRAIANKVFENEKFGPDFLAECFLPSHFKFFIRFKKVRANIRKKLDKLLPGLHEYMIARTAFFDTLFVNALKEKIPQIVLLGAGLDSRAYRFSNLNSATKIIELDIATTQNRKKKCLRKARIDIPEQVSFVPIDFNRESLKNVLEKAGYDNNRKTLFLWEGVSYYLQAESVDATLELVSRSSHKKNIIALDYAVQISEENNNYYGVKEFFQTMKKRHSGEKLLFAVEEGTIESFLEHRALKMIDHLDNEEIEKTFLLNENGLSIGKITGHFRFLTASPK